MWWATTDSYIPWSCMHNYYKPVCGQGETAETAETAEMPETTEK